MTLPVAWLDELPDLPWREKLAYLSFTFHKLPQAECPLKHSFENGSYVREIEIPKGTIFIGRAHKIGHQVELLSGSVIHVKENCRRVVQAPFCMTTSPGDQVCAQALTDIRARTVHPDNGGHDIDLLELKWFEPISELNKLGEEVDQRLRQRKTLYERNSSSGWHSGGGWSGRYRVCRF